MREPAWQNGGQESEDGECHPLLFAPTVPYRLAFPSAGSAEAWVLQVPHTSCSTASPSLANLPPAPRAYLREAGGAGVGDAGGRAPRRAQQPCQEAAQPFGAEPPVAGVGGQPGGSQQPPAQHVAAH